jgi:peroxiredoxin
MPKVMINTPAPDFSLYDFQGKKFQLSDLKGHENGLIVFNRGFF